MLVALLFPVGKKNGVAAITGTPRPCEVVDRIRIHRRVTVIVHQIHGSGADTTVVDAYASRDYLCAPRAAPRRRCYARVFSLPHQNGYTRGQAIHHIKYKTSA